MVKSCLRRSHPPNGKYLCVFAGVLYTVAVSASTAGAAITAGQRFLSECRSNVDTTLSFQVASAAPAEFSGHSILIRARIGGIVQTNDHATYLFQLPDGTNPSIGTTRSLTFNSGDSVMVLARIPTGWTGREDLELVDIVSLRDGDWALSHLMEASTQAPRAAAAASPAVQTSEPPFPAAAPRSGHRSPYAVPSSSRSYGGEMLSARRQLLEQYSAAVRWFNPRLSATDSQAIAGHIIWYSQANGVDARLIMAVIGVESEFDVHATSNHGAMGLGQLMPGTARDLGVTNAYDPEQNIAGAVRLIRWHLQQNVNSHDPLALALASYNAGENAVKRFHGVPPYAETQRYIWKIKRLYAQLCRGDG